MLIILPQLTSYSKRFKSLITSQLSQIKEIWDFDNLRIVANFFKNYSGSDSCQVKSSLFRQSGHFSTTYRLVSIEALCAKIAKIAQ